MGSCLKLWADKNTIIFIGQNTMSTKEESLSTELTVMEHATNIAMDLEKNDLFAAEQKLCEMDEDLGHLKVLVGPESSRFKTLDNIKGNLKLKLDGAKNKAGEYF